MTFTGGNQHWTPTQTTFPNLTSGRYSIQNNFGEYLEIPAGEGAGGSGGLAGQKIDRPAGHGVAVLPRIYAHSLGPEIVIQLEQPVAEDRDGLTGPSRRTR